MRNIVLALSLTFIFIVMTGCNSQDISKKIEDNVNDRVQLAKEEITNKLDESVKSQINESVSSAMQTIEGLLDPKLGEIRKNMNNIREVALVYYKINKKMPPQEKIEVFFDKKFSQMTLEYKVSNDESRAFLVYSGKDYTKEKVPDIIIDPNQN